MTWGAWVKAGADRLGIGAQTRRVILALGPEGWRRDIADNQALRTLITAALDFDGTFVDVGAHNGDFIADALRCAPLGQHMAIEPLPDYAARLRIEFPTVTVHEVAASDEEGSTSFHYQRGEPQRSGIRRQDAKGGSAAAELLTVRKAKLDDLLDGWPAPQIIKVDVEGAEREVIEGAMKTITTHRPLVVFEHHYGAAEYGTTPQHLWDLLVDGAGLRIFDLSGEGPYTLDRLEAVRSSGQVVNFFARV